MLVISMQANMFWYCTGKIEDILETLEEFQPQSCSNLLIYVNQYAFLQTIFRLACLLLFLSWHLAGELGHFH